MILPCTYRTFKLLKSISIIFNRNQVRVPREKFSGQGFFVFWVFFCHTVRNLSSRTRIGTHAPCSRSMESQLLDPQESSLCLLLVWTYNKQSQNSFVQVFNRYLLRVQRVPDTAKNWATLVDNTAVITVLNGILKERSK